MTKKEVATFDFVLNFDFKIFSTRLSANFASMIFGLLTKFKLACLSKSAIELSNLELFSPLIKTNAILYLLKKIKKNYFWKDLRSLLLKTTRRISIIPITVCILPKMFKMFESIGKSHVGDVLSPINGLK